MRQQAIRVLSIATLVAGIATLVIGAVTLSQPVTYTTTPPPRTAQEQANYGATVAMLNSLADAMGLLVIGIGAVFTCLGIALVIAAWSSAPAAPVEALSEITQA